MYARPAVDVVRGIDALPLETGAARTSGSAVTIGFFDGVHRGHQAVLRRTVEIARQGGLRAVAVTFDRHPREVLTPGREPKLLTAMQRKSALIQDLDVEALVVLEFTEEFSRWSPEEFVRRVLVEGLAARHAVVGSNFTFGHKAMGNLMALADLGAAAGFTVEGVAVLRIEGRPVSSSSVREALAQGDLAWPTEALGHRFVLDGEVVAGAGRGAGLGWPTANLKVDPRLLMPGEGVYAGRAGVGDEWCPAAINVGTNPTFGEEPLHAEAHLLDYGGGDLRGRPMALEFWERLRDEIRFDAPQALALQIEDDVERTRARVGPVEAR